MRKVNATDIVAVAGAAALAAALLLPQPGSLTQSQDRFQRIAYALEAYALDNNGSYPPDSVPGNSDFSRVLSQRLTTPVPYLMPADLYDPLPDHYNSRSKRISYVNFDGTFRDSEFVALREEYKKYHALHGSWLIWSDMYFPRNPATGLIYDPIPYDATNGSLSEGTVFRSQRHISETSLKPI